MAEGTVELADGRKLGYAQWGPSHAPAVLYCHGFPTNRHELDLLQPVLKRNAIQVNVLVLNRPGYGPSSFQARRTILDWPRDVAEAADRLGIGRFAVLGVSGGCPYALACGYALRVRVTRIGIVVGVAPIEPAKRALARAAELATAFGSEVIVTSVAPVIHGRGIGPVDPVDPPELHRDELQHAPRRPKQSPAARTWLRRIRRVARME